MRQQRERKVAVVTGAGAGVGRAVALAFAKNGFDVGLLSRDAERLAQVRNDVEALGARGLAISTDVADAAAVEAAAAEVERELGPIAVWVNVAMSTVFAPVHELTAEEVGRATQVTYLGQVHGTMAALRYMRARNRGTIINVGSALGRRSVPLQSAYCGAKAAVRGFTDSLRSELLHDGIDITLTMVDLPAVNTPQFDWARNKTGRLARPMAPVFEPEVAARAILFAATHRRREIWVGMSTLKAIVANSVAPGLLDRVLARKGYSGQLQPARTPPDQPDNLFTPVQGHYGARGRFGDEAAGATRTWLTDRHRTGFWVAAAAALALLASRKSGR